jgi:hypothetical protein
MPVFSVTEVRISSRRPVALAQSSILLSPSRLGLSNLEAEDRMRTAKFCYADRTHICKFYTILYKLRDNLDG